MLDGGTAVHEVTRSFRGLLLIAEGRKSTFWTKTFMRVKTVTRIS